MKCTEQAARMLPTIRTRYPWAVANNDQVVVAVYNYAQSAKAHAKRDPDNLVAFNAAGVVFDVPPKTDDKTL